MDPEYTIFFCEDDAHLEEIHDRFSPHVHSLMTREGVGWKYRDNPYGHALFGFAVDDDNRIIGQQAFLPRPFSIGGRRVEATQAVDAIVLPEFRRHGVYQQIWKRANKLLAERNLMLVGFTSDDGMSISTLQKEGLRRVDHFRSFYKIIRPISLLKGKVFKRPGGTGGSLVKGLDALYTFFVAGSSGELEVTPVERFESGVACGSGTVFAERSQEYLNWRFVDNPTRNFTPLTIRDGDEQVGHCAVLLEERSAHLFDFYCNNEDERVVGALTSYIYRTFPQVEYISFKCIDTGPLSKMLRRCGFMVRKNKETMLIGGVIPEEVKRESVLWHVTIGDTDW